MFQFPRVPSVSTIPPQHGSNASLASNRSKTTAGAMFAGQKRPRTISEGAQDARRGPAFRYNAMHNENDVDSQSLKLPLNLQHSPIFRATIAEGTRIRSASDNIDGSIESALSIRHPSDPRLQALRHVVIPEIGGDNKTGEVVIDTSPVTSEAELLERAKLKGMVDAIYKEFEAVDEEGIRALKEVVYENLLDMGISPKELESILIDLENADSRLSLIKGVLSALGFIVGGRIGEVVMPMLKPLLPAFLLALTPGLIVAVSDRGLSSVLHDALPDYFTAPNPDVLKDVMQKCLQRFERPLTREMLVQTGALFFPYSLRNVGGSTLSPVISQKYLKIYSDFFAFLAGWDVQNQRDFHNKKDLLMHPAYFFGRNDWMQRLQEFRSPTSQKLMHMINGAWKGARFIPTMVGNAFSRLFTLNGTTETVLLSFGFALVAYVNAAVEAYFKNSSDSAKNYAASSANTASLMALYILLGAAMTCSSRATQRLARVQPCPEAPPAPSPVSIRSIRSLNNVQHY